MRIIQESRMVEVVSYQHHFDWEGKVNHGFAFECDENGNIDTEKKAPVALENYRKCVSGEYKVVDRGIQRHVHTYREPRVGRCACHETVILDRFTNTCDGCGRDYNSSGQELASRSQWGEETGEHLADIERIR